MAPAPLYCYCFSSFTPSSFVSLSFSPSPSHTTYLALCMSPFLCISLGFTSVSLSLFLLCVSFVSSVSLYLDASVSLSFPLSISPSLSRLLALSVALFTFPSTCISLLIFSLSLCAHILSVHSSLQSCASNLSLLYQDTSVVVGLVGTDENGTALFDGAVYDGASVKSHCALSADLTISSHTKYLLCSLLKMLQLKI